MRRALLGLAALALASCQPEVSKDVMIVGDSVTWQSAEEITKEFSWVNENDGGSYIASFGLGGGGQGLTYVYGVPLANMDAWWSVHVASLMQHGQPEVLLVGLGYNDCAHTDGYGDRIDNFMEQTGSVDVLWLTLADQNDAWNGGHCDDVINAALSAATTRWSNLRLLPYREWALANPSYFADAVHLNSTGQTKYADWMKGQLDALYG